MIRNVHDSIVEFLRKIGGMGHVHSIIKYVQRMFGDETEDLNYRDARKYVSSALNGAAEEGVFERISSPKSHWKLASYQLDGPTGGGATSPAAGAGAVNNAILISVKPLKTLNERLQALLNYRIPLHFFLENLLVLLLNKPVVGKGKALAPAKPSTKPLSSSIKPLSTADGEGGEGRLNRGRERSTVEQQRGGRQGVERQQDVERQDDGEKLEQQDELDEEEDGDDKTYKSGDLVEYVKKYWSFSKDNECEDDSELDIIIDLVLSSHPRFHEDPLSADSYSIYPTRRRSRPIRTSLPATGVGASLSSNPTPSAGAGGGAAAAKKPAGVMRKRGPQAGVAAKKDKEKSPWIRCDRCHTWVEAKDDNIRDVTLYDDNNPNHLDYYCPRCRTPEEDVQHSHVQSLQSSSSKALLHSSVAGASSNSAAVHVAAAAAAAAAAASSSSAAAVGTSAANAGRGARGPGGAGGCPLSRYNSDNIMQNKRSLLSTSGASTPMAKKMRSHSQHHAEPAFDYSSCLTNILNSCSQLCFPSNDDSDVRVPKNVAVPFAAGICGEGKIENMERELMTKYRNSSTKRTIEKNVKNDAVGKDMLVLEEDFLQRMSTVATELDLRRKEAFDRIQHHYIEDLLKITRLRNDLLRRADDSFSHSLSEYYSIRFSALSSDINDLNEKQNK